MGGYYVGSMCAACHALHEEKVMADTGDVAPPLAMMAAGAVATFRCVRERAQIDADSLIISKATADALKVKVGDIVRCVE